MGGIVPLLIYSLIWLSEISWVGLDKYVCIREVGDHPTTPTSRPRLLKFSVLATPSIL